jgi:O-antigen/teichoic acid export membrane protein
MAQLLIAVLGIWICYAFLPSLRLSLPINIFPLLKATLPFAALTFLIVLSQRLGVLTVSALEGDAATGIFSTVTRIVDGLKFGHYAILGALLPVISRRTQESKHTFRAGFFLLAGLSLMIAIGLALFARLIILVIFGVNYISGIPLLSMLGWSLIPYTISSFISYELIAHEQEFVLMKATMVSLAVFLILYIWLISAYKLTGAVYAAIAGETVQALLFILFRSSVTNRQQIALENSQL